MERGGRHSRRSVAKPAAGVFDRRPAAARRLSRDALDVAAGAKLPGPVDQARGAILHAVRRVAAMAYAGPLGMSENRVSHATGPMLAATINSAASAPSSKLPRLAY